MPALVSSHKMAAVGAQSENTGTFQAKRVPKIGVTVSEWVLPANLKTVLSGLF